MSTVSAVVFDLDGTLIDSRGDIVAAVNHALVGSGRRPLPAQTVVRYVGDGARALCARAAQLPESAAEVDELVERFVSYYVEHPIEFSRWMPGAQETLEALADLGELSLAICTNKPRATADALLGALGVRTRFRAIVAGGDTAEKKPAPGPLLRALELVDVAPSRAVMVGDGPQDVEAARRAGVRAVAVLGGFASEDRLRAARPDLVLGGLSELPAVVTRWRSATARIKR